MTYVILENSNYLVSTEDAGGLPMLIEMTPEQFMQIYGDSQD